MDLIGLLYGFGVLQGALLAIILLFAPSGHKIANRFMAALVASIALNLTHSALIRADYYLENPGTWIWLPALNFCWGPLLYCYAYSLTRKRIPSIQWLHFAPAVALFAAITSAYFGATEQDQRLFLEYFWSPRNDPYLLRNISTIIPTFWQIWIDWHLQGHLFVLQFGVYCYLVVSLIRAHNQRMEQHFSNMDKVNLRWLRVLSLACLIFLVLYLMMNRTHVQMTGYFDSGSLLPSIPFLFLVAIIYIIGIAALFQSSLIRGALVDTKTSRTPDNSEDQSAAHLPPTQTASTKEKNSEIAANISEPKASPSEKYKRSGLTSEQAQDFKETIIATMESGEHYLDDELTLPDFALHTGLTPHQVSQVINEYIGQNFFNFVSHYRIDRAKQLLRDERTRNMAIVDIAMEVGFKSKSSFYNAFKKETQMTPTQFKRSLPQA